MTITIGSHRYTLVFLPRSRMPKGDNGEPACGICDPPTNKRPRIRIRKGQSEFNELDTLIHELLHAAVFPLKEGWVAEGSTHIAEMLERFGVCKLPSEQPIEPDYEMRDIIRGMLRMSYLHLDDQWDGWTDRTSNEIFAVLTKLGYGT